MRRSTHTRGGVEAGTPDAVAMAADHGVVMAVPPIAKAREHGPRKSPGNPLSEAAPPTVLAALADQPAYPTEQAQVGQVVPSGEHEQAGQHGKAQAGHVNPGLHGEQRRVQQPVRLHAAGHGRDV